RGRRAFLAAPPAGRSSPADRTRRVDGSNERAAFRDNEARRARQARLPTPRGIERAEGDAWRRRRPSSFSLGLRPIPVEHRKRDSGSRLAVFLAREIAVLLADAALDMSEAPTEAIARPSERSLRVDSMVTSEVD